MTRKLYIGMREKDIGDWLIFGENPDGIHVDVVGEESDVIDHIPRELAHRLIAIRRDFVEKIYAALEEYR